MKRICIVLVLLLSLIFTSCTTIDGYSYSIEDARNSQSFYAKFYDDYDYIFTAEQENRIVDFLICGDYVRIIKIDCKENNGKRLYKIKGASTSSISESLSHSESQREEAWTKTSNFLFQVEWMIVTKNTDSLQEGFDFTYNGKECVLLYRIIE